MADVPVASFHLVEVPLPSSIAGIARIGLDRRDLSSVPGLRFARVLGCGRDGRMANSFQANRRAVFAVWDDEVALDRFLAAHHVARRWAEASATWHVRLRLLGGHGRWAGERVLDGLDRAVADADTGRTYGGAVVTLTRAAIRPGAIRAFTQAGRALTGSLDAVPGLRCVVGVGEVPVARLGTVAVWDSEAAAVGGSAQWQEHARAMEAAVDGGWFGESLFARFEPTWSSGTWSGVDPVAGQAGSRSAVASA